MPLVKAVRDAGVAAEIYPTAAKMKKQLGYADSKGIKYVAIVGSDEMEQKKVTLKNMETGEQEMLTISDVIERIK